MMGTSEEEVRTIAEQAQGVVLPIVGAYPTLLVRPRIDGVKGFCNGEDTTVEGEELQGVDGLMFVHLLVDGLVLLLYGL